MSEKTTVVLDTDLARWEAWWKALNRRSSYREKAAHHRDAVLIAAPKELATDPPRLEVIVESFGTGGHPLYMEVVRAIGTDYPEAAHLLEQEPARSYRRNEPPTRDAPLADWFAWYHGCNAGAGRREVTLADVAQGVDRGLSTIKRAHAAWVKEPR